MVFHRSLFAGVFCLFFIFGASFSQATPSITGLSFSPRWSLELADYPSLNKIVSGGGKYVAYTGWATAGSMGRVYLGISHNGYSWINQELPGTSSGTPAGMANYVVGYGGGDWLVVLAASGWMSNPPRVFRSQDGGESWNELIGVSFSTPFSGSPSEPLVYLQGTWFFSSGSSLWASTDRGLTWVVRGSSPAGQMLSLIGKANDVLFARGNAGILFYSTDLGFSWVQASIPAGFSNILDVEFGNNVYVAVTSGGGVLTSSDLGATWIARVTESASSPAPGMPPAGGAGNSLTDVTFGSGMFLLSNGKTSVDGISWIPSLRWIPQTTGGGPPGQTPFANFAYGQDGFVGVTTSAPNFGSIIQSVSGSAPVLNPSSAGEIIGEIGNSLSHTFHAPGATGYALSSVPPGLTFNPITGTLSGTPTELACRYLVVYAINGAAGSDPVIVKYSVQNPGGAPVPPLHFASRWRGESGQGPLRLASGPNTYLAYPGYSVPNPSFVVKSSSDGVSWQDVWLAILGGIWGPSPDLVITRGAEHWLMAYVYNNFINLRKASDGDFGNWQEPSSVPTFPGTFSGAGRSLSGLVHGDGKWILFGWLANTGGDQTLWVSEDGGINWLNRSPSNGPMPVSQIRHVAVGGGKLVASGDSGNFWVSGDWGVTWNSVVIPGDPNFVGLAYGNNRFVVAASDGKVWTSTDAGATWVQQLAPAPPISWMGGNVLSSVVFGGGLFLLSDGRCSADGIRWTGSSQWVPQYGLGGVLSAGGGVSVSLAHGPAGFLAADSSWAPAGMNNSQLIYQSVSPGVPSWSSGSPDTEKAQWGVPFSRTLQAAGAISYQGSNLPDWLSLDPATGILSGVPVNPAPVGPAAPANGNILYTMVFYATNSSGISGARVYTLDVSRDITPPQITLLGENPMTIYKRSGPMMPPGSGFTDPGAQVTDDQEATRTIYGMNAVNENMVGTYTITYSTSDSYGNAATPVIRTVNVVLDPTGDEDGDGLTNGQETTLGTNPSQKDTDNDGVNDPVEVADGTNPSDVNSYRNFSQGLEAYFRFNGDSQDSSGHGRHATGVAVVLTNGLYGQTNGSYRFNGVDSYMTVAGIPIPTDNAFTWSLWINPESAKPYQAIVERAQALGNNAVSPWIFLNPDRKIQFMSYPPGDWGISSGSHAYQTNQWVHVAVTSTTNGIRRLYVDSVPVDEKTTSEYGHPLELLILGADRLMRPSYVEDIFYEGRMDEVRIYSRTLSAVEVGQLYQQGAPPDTVPPVITLIGADPLEIYRGSIFTDPGATVTDNVDATRTITGSGSVDTSTVGIYTLTYTAQDAAGNLAVPVTRTVNVVLDPAADEDGDGLTNGLETLLGSNPLLADSNGDGIGDGQAHTLGLSPSLNLAPLLDFLRTNPVAGLYNQTQFESNRIQGRADVTNHPAAYHLVTQAEHEANRVSGRNDVIQNPNAYNLYQTNQIHEMSIGKVVLERTADGFMFNYQVEQSEDLANWVPYQINQLHITNVPGNKMFLRVRASE